MQLITCVGRIGRAYGVNITRGLTRKSKETDQVLPTLTLFTKEHCSLCDDAMDVLHPHLSKVGKQ